MYEKDFFERLNLQQLCAFLRTGAGFPQGRGARYPVGANPPGGGCLGGRDESVP